MPEAERDLRDSIESLLMSIDDEFGEEVMSDFATHLIDAFNRETE
jgi:hypothetical protein